MLKHNLSMCYCSLTKYCWRVIRHQLLSWCWRVPR